MEDAVGMGVGQRLGDDRDDPGHAVRIGARVGEVLPALPARLDRRVRRGGGHHVLQHGGPLGARGRVDQADHAIQGQPGPVRHAQPAQAGLGVVHHGEDRDDVGVIQPPLDGGLLAPVGRDLQRHGAIAQGLVIGQEHAGRAPLAEDPPSRKERKRSPGRAKGALRRGADGLAEQHVVAELR